MRGPATLSTRYTVVQKELQLVQKQLWSMGTLRQALSSSAHDGKSVQSNKARRVNKRTSLLPIATLDPHKLGVQDVVDISGMLSAVVTPSSGCYSPDPDENGDRIIYKTNVSYKLDPFPPGTIGFLYFHRRSPRPHVAAGEIRFRVIKPEASQNDGEMFSLGTDLMVDGGRAPWRIHLINIFNRHTALRRLLVTDGFINPAEEVDIDKLLWDMPVGYIHHPQILESIVDPFIIRTGYPNSSFVILHKESIYYGTVLLLFRRPDKANKYRAGGLKGGKLLVRFELANIRNKAGTHNVKIVLRVLKIVEPPSPSEAEITDQTFKEGELVQRYDYFTKTATHPWAVKPSRLHLTPSSLEVLKEIYLKDGAK